MNTYIHVHRKIVLADALTPVMKTLKDISAWQFNQTRR